MTANYLVTWDICARLVQFCCSTELSTSGQQTVPPIKKSKYAFEPSGVAFLFLSVKKWDDNVIRRWSCPPKLASDPPTLMDRSFKRAKEDFGSNVHS
jgi:hypothetical protein